MTQQPPDLPDWFPQLAEVARRARESMLRSIGPALDQQRRAIEQLAARGAFDYLERMKPVLAKVGALLEANTPPNWQGLEAGQFGQAIDVVSESGLCLVWSPPLDVVQRVIASPSLNDRLAILEAEAPAVLEDLDRLISESEATDVEGHADACTFASRAVAAARDGHFEAAQALAACGLGQILHVSFDYPLFGGLGKAHRDFKERDLERTGRVELKVAVLQTCTAKSLTNIEKADPGGGFNRHATGHGTLSFFSTPNSLAGLILLVAWVRELKWLADHHPEAFRERE